MILDAETFGQVAAVDRILRGVEGLVLPGSLKTELFASVFEINTNVCATAAEIDEALPALRARRGRCGRRGRPRDRGRSDASVRPPRGPADRQGGAVRDVRRLRRHLGAPPGRPGAARARRHAVGRGLLALPRGDRPVAPGRARHVGELAVVRRRAERDGVEPRADPRRAAARRRAARVRLVRGVGVVGRPARGARRRRGLHADLVGRPSASEARDARGARPRPADGRPALGGVRRAPAGALRDCARRRAAGERSAAGRPWPRRLQPEPLVGGAVRAPRAVRASGRRELRAGRRARRRAARARPAGGAWSSAAPSCSRVSTPQPARPTCSSSRNRRTRRRRISSAAR